jgi:hypothetical protein
VELKTEYSFQQDENRILANVTIKNPSNIVAIALKLNLRDSKTGERILPAYFSDGYFTLFPGEEKTIEMECLENTAGREVHISVEGYNVERQSIESL